MSFEIFNNDYCHICIGLSERKCLHRYSRYHFAIYLLSEILFYCLAHVVYPINPLMLLRCVDGGFFLIMVAQVLLKRQ